jgi:CelD/BcsL family acetyltransferase involved in cellulose biosynthesis
LESIAEIRRARAPWDRLWDRSESNLPTTRAESVAQWTECFAPRARLRVLVVEQDGEMAAVLPLAARRLRGVLTVGDLTRNFWSPNGDLLLDRDADAGRVLARLADGVAELPWPLARLDIVPWQATAWAGFIDTLGRRGLKVDLHQRGCSAQLTLRDSFGDFEAGQSSRQRYNLRRNWKRLEAGGPVCARFYSEFAPTDVERKLRQALAIEHRSWKGQIGGSVLGTPRVFQFFRRQAQTLAQWGTLRLAFLERDGQAIAFELGYAAKGVYHSAKIGYDPAYRRFGPGQLLRRELIRWLHCQPGQSRIDFHADPTPSLARWSNGSCPMARLVVAPRRCSSLALFGAYQALAPLVRRLRRAGCRREDQRRPADSSSPRAEAAQV